MLGIAIVQERALDAEALAALFADRKEFSVVKVGSRLPDVAGRKRATPYDAIIIDASRSGELMLEPALEVIEAGHTQSALLLDDVADDVRQQAIERYRKLAYTTRNSSFAELRQLLLKLAEPSARPPTPRKTGRTDATHGNGLRPGSPYSKRLQSLTPREAEVFRLIAMGKSVKQSARILQLAVNTVDNHKSRMMKKLDVHKASDLTRLAIRAGVIRA